MGLAASQARLLFITGRKCDVEYAQMKIANEKISLSRESTAEAEEYSRALSQRKLTWTTGDTSVDLSYGLLMNPNNSVTTGQYLLTDVNGRVVLSDDYKSKLGLTTTSGTGGQFKSVFPTSADFLVKTMDISKADAQQYAAVSGNSASTTNTSSTAYNTTLAQDVNSMKSVLGQIPQGSDTISEPIYASLKSSLTALTTKTGDQLKTLGYTLNDGQWIAPGSIDVKKDKSLLGKIAIGVAVGVAAAVTGGAALAALPAIAGIGGTILGYTAASVVGGAIIGATGAVGLAAGYAGSQAIIGDAKGKSPDGTGFVSGNSTATNVDATQVKYLMTMYNTARASLELLEYAKTNNQTPEALACLAAIKGLVTGQQVSGDSGSIGGAYHKHNQGNWSDSQDVAADLINSVAKTSGNTEPGREKYYTGNITDMASLYTGELTPAATETASTLTAQDTADYYINLYNALGSKGWKCDSNITDKDYMQNGIRNGNFYLQQLKSGGWSSLSTGDASSPVNDVLDKDEIAQAEAQHEINQSKLSTKEEQLDLKMKNLDTERAALDTEVDSVKAVINKNIERSFKMFQA